MESAVTCFFIPRKVFTRTVKLRAYYYFLEYNDAQETFRRHNVVKDKSLFGFGIIFSARAEKAAQFKSNVIEKKNCRKRSFGFRNSFRRVSHRKRNNMCNKKDRCAIITVLFLAVVFCANLILINKSFNATRDFFTIVFTSWSRRETHKSRSDAKYTLAKYIRLEIYILCCKSLRAR